jgi:flavin reductase (DIM6/NTAB) family NADH-FMN oxidoreductase RutF
MNATSATATYGTNEFEQTNLTQAPSRLVVPPRVATSPVNFECKVIEIIQLKSHTGTLAQSWLTLGEVIAVHINRKLLVNGTLTPSPPTSSSAPAAPPPTPK